MSAATLEGLRPGAPPARPRPRRRDDQPRARRTRRPREEPPVTEPRTRRRSTSIRAGPPTPSPCRPAARRAAGAPMNPPITMSSTYVHDAALEYGRDGNAGWGALETALGALDGGRAVTFAIGTRGRDRDRRPRSARAGPSCSRRLTYFGVRNIFERLEARGRLTVRLVHADDTAAVLAAADGADMVWVESIANPLIVVADVPAIAAGARAARRAHGRRRDVRDAAPPAPARARRRHRPPLGDQVHRRPLGPAAGRGRLPGRGARGLPSSRSATTTARSRARSRPSSRSAGLRTLAVRLDRAEASAAELARRLAAHPARVARSTTRACRATRSTSARRASSRTAAGRCSRSRSPVRSSRPRRSSAGSGCSPTRRASAASSR